MKSEPVSDSTVLIVFMALSYYILLIFGMVWLETHYYAFQRGDYDALIISITQYIEKFRP